MVKLNVYIAYSTMLDKNGERLGATFKTGVYAAKSAEEVRRKVEKSNRRWNAWSKKRSGHSTHFSHVKLVVKKKKVRQQARPVSGSMFSPTLFGLGGRR
jgi:hypothetical protein